LPSKFWRSHQRGAHGTCPACQTLDTPLHVYIRKTNLQKTLEITEISRRELLNYTKQL